MTPPTETDEETPPDRASPIRLFINAVKGMAITPFVRIIAAAVAGVYGFMAWDPLFNPDKPAYDEPIYTAIRQFASLQAWGLGFLVAALMLLFAAVSARAAIYTAGIVFATAHLFAWASMVIYEAQSNPDASLTSGAIGLHLGTLVAVVGLAYSPRQISVDKPIVAVLDDNSVKPLRRVG